MKKTIIMMTGAAFLGAATLAPVPAHAVIPLFLPFALAQKQAPDMKAANTAAPHKAAKKGKKKKM